MRADWPGLLPLICPGCRARTERGREVHTVSVVEVLRAAPVPERGPAGRLGHAPGDPEEIEEGVLGCDNPACRRRYPIVGGIPILVPDLGAFLEGNALAVVEAELHPATLALLAEPGSDHTPLAHQMDLLSIYLDSHWGDRTTPAATGPGPRFGYEAVAGRLAACARAPVERAVELGCGVGRGVAELARGAALVVGVDLGFAALRRARRLLRGDPLPFARRVAGRHYETATARAGDRAAANVALVCGDALDPPLCPAAFDRVAALNLLDAVTDPARLVSVVDALCRPGGEILLSSPYEWQTGIVDEQSRLGALDPGAAVRERVERGIDLETPYTVEAEADLIWWLRRTARAGSLYSAHWLRARKGNPER